MKNRIKITIGLFVGFVMLAILHNAIYGIFGTEEAVFFILALLCGAAFSISLVCNAIISTVDYFKNRETEERTDESKLVFMYAFSIAVMILGMIFNLSGIGKTAFSTFGSVGNWLLYVGFAGLILSLIKSVWKTKRVVDERMYFVATKANRLTFLILIIFSFVIIVIDGIKPITIPYHLFMSYLISGIVLVYAALYKILLKYY
jgi:hypothetical protein